MKFDDLKSLYLSYKTQYKADTYKYISRLLIEAKKIHKQDWDKKPTTKGDHEQSWRAFKGKNLEKLIMFMIESEINDLNLKVVNGATLDKQNLSHELEQVKHRILVDYRCYGMHLPDVDLVIFDPNEINHVVLLSVKVTLRERIAQTAYWKLKLLANAFTKSVQVYFITLDEDETLKTHKPAKKGRAIVEVDLDACYVLTEAKFEESAKVKSFSNLIPDLITFFGRSQNN